MSEVEDHCSGPHHSGGAASAVLCVVAGVWCGVLGCGVLG